MPSGAGRVLWLAGLSPERWSCVYRALCTHLRGARVRLPVAAITARSDATLSVVAVTATMSSPTPTRSPLPRRLRRPLQAAGGADASLCSSLRARRGRMGQALSVVSGDGSATEHRLGCIAQLSQVGNCL